MTLADLVTLAQITLTAACVVLGLAALYLEIE